VTPAKKTTTSSLRIVEGVDAARAEVITRPPFGQAELPEAVQASIVELWGEPLSAAEHVARIIADVEKDGDAAVSRYSQLFDGSSYDTIEVPRSEISEAFDSAPREQIDAVEFATNRIRQYHKEQLRHAPQSFSARGTGMVVRPLERAGIYMTGSDAALPSSVIHTAVPGSVAGVDELIGVTATQPDGRVSPLKLVAAHLAGIKRVFRASGPQAIAALAIGTETIPRVDKIYGPGNIFVTLAKQQLYGRVGIDAIYGPTETMVIADESASTDLVAADLLAQAEHDRLSMPVLLTNSRAVADAVAQAIEAQLESLDRAEIARAAVANGGAAVLDSLDQCVELANEFASEHLCLLVAEPDELLPKIRNAGGIFVGESSPEVLGDYTAGPSHVMPTGGSARFASPLSVLDFLKVTSTVRFDEHELERQGPYAAALARSEGLTAHASSIERRIEGR
jgi:histidinol dehydrogenase